MTLAITNDYENPTRNIYSSCMFLLLIMEIDGNNLFMTLSSYPHIINVFDSFG